MIDAKRARAVIWEEMLKTKVARVFNKRVKKRGFQVGQMVLRRSDVQVKVTKLQPKWDEPFIISQVLGHEAHMLKDGNGRELGRPWNVALLRAYYT